MPANKPAIDAIHQGKTRGQFIRENSTNKTPKPELQKLSDAYSAAMKELAGKCHKEVSNAR